VPSVPVLPNNCSKEALALPGNPGNICAEHAC
jgi:hypothetical protein